MGAIAEAGMGDLLGKLANFVRGGREPDPFIVTKCRCEAWGRFHSDRTHLGLPRVSTFARDTFIRSPVYSGNDEPPEIAEVTVAVDRMRDARRKRIIKRYFCHRRTIKEIAAEEGVGVPRMYKLFNLSLADVQHGLQLAGETSPVTKGE